MEEFLLIQLLLHFLYDFQNMLNHSKLNLKCRNYQVVLLHKKYMIYIKYIISGGTAAVVDRALACYPRMRQRAQRIMIDSR